MQNDTFQDLTFKNFIFLLHHNITAEHLKNTHTSNFSNLFLEHHGHSKLVSGWLEDLKLISR
ncbi:hypothetical protein HanXRQr2_Chr12g0547311 [Helianthus annuus]|uniref:Uncharacterized protein n=1 Tax=Helianthus annuus TaxID=4232 RepID=A0A251STK1_HELAN|nr:hypothetical protein HanXRQr2_Chr12g0547311 [Helianthus annuus]KAJ0863167.1 hypothetical protein HanPSC8_Chr12g0526791 [Helianthus annuus]